jgi:hypothetical protein
MAITYNSQDNVHYGTDAERLADTKVLAQPTAKFWAYDTKKLWITDGTTWYEM